MFHMSTIVSGNMALLLSTQIHVFINNDKGNVIYYFFLFIFILTNLNKPIFTYL
jgi:hypothetical protein